MSRRKPSTSATVPPAASLSQGTSPRGGVTPRVALALAWLILFCVWFYSFGLPNNRPAERWMVWTALPFDLLDLFDPPVQPNEPPWSWLYLGQRVPFLAIASFLWTAAICLGRLELRALRACPLFSRSERLYFAGCLGLATISLTMLGLGLLGFISRWPLLILLTAGSLWEASLTWRDCRSRPDDTVKPQSSPPAPGDADSSVWLPRVVGVVIAPFVFCMLLGAMSPQTDFDVIEYHLGGPKEWYLQGQITRLPHNVYTSFPFLTEMLLLSGMVLYGGWEWGALAGQAAIAGFAPLTALGLYATARRWFAPSAGWLAALVWLTTPWVYRISIIAYAEGGLACYLFAALAIGLRLAWSQPDESSAPAAGPAPTDAASNSPPDTSGPSDSTLVFLCGVLAGSGMACKYTGLVSVVVPVGLLLAWRALQTRGRGRFQRLILAGVVYGAGVLVAVGPWLLKNTIETGNPVFPLAYSIFDGEGRDAALDAQWRRGHSRHYPSQSDRLRDLPVKLTDVVANNDWHSALMFGLAPIALLARWRKKVWSVWAFIAWQFLSWFLLTHQIDRFYVPMFPAVALLAGCGAGWLFASGPGRWCAAAVMTASILFNAEIMQIQRVTGFNAGRLDLRAAADIAVAPSLKWLNEQYAAGRLPPDFKVLCVGEAALFHAKFPLVYNTVFDRSLLEQWCAEKMETNGATEFQLRPAEQIRATLRQHGITHLLVNWSEILRYREPGSYGYTPLAHPDWLARLQAAGVLEPPMAMPESAWFVGVNDAKRKQAEEWAPDLVVSVSGHTGLRSVQLFPVRR